MRPVHLLLAMLLSSFSTIASPFPSDFEDQVKARLDNGTYEETVSYIQSIIDGIADKNSDNYAFAFYWLGITHYENNFYDKALDAYHKSNNVYITLIDKFPNGTILCRKELGMLVDDMGDHELAIQYYEEVLALEKEHSPNDIEEINQTYQWLSTAYFDDANYTKSIAITQEHIQLLKKTKPVPFTKLALAYSNLGSSLQNMGSYQEAEINLKEALQIANKNNIDHQDIITLLNNLGALYTNTNRLNEALPLYQQVVAIQEKNDKGSPVLAKLLSNLATCNTYLKNYDAAEKQLNRALNLMVDAFGESHINSIIMLNNIGGIYEEKNQYVNAAVYYKKVIELGRANYAEHPFMGVFKSNLATCYEKEKNYPAALKLYNEVLDLFIKLNPKGARVAQTYNDIARVYWHQESNLTKGIDLIYQSLTINMLKEHSIEELKNDLSIVVTSNFKSYNNARKALHFLSELQQEMHTVTNDISWLKAALATREIEAQYTRKHKSTIVNTKDQLKVVSRIARTSSSALRIIEMLYDNQPDENYLEMALNFAEFNKSAILAGTLQGSQAFKFGNIPDSLRTQERHLKKEYNTVKKAFIQATNKEDTIAIRAAQEALINIEFQQGQFQKKLEQVYPKYSKYKYEQQQLNIKEIQNTLLDNNTALLEYFIYDTSAYLLVITQQKTILLPLHVSVETIQKKIKRLRQGLSNYTLIGNNEKKSFILYATAAYELHQLLIAPASHLLTNSSRLIIIPDGDLGNIPFEVLLEKPSNQKFTKTYQELSYLLKRYDISYSYSIALLLDNKKHQQRQNNGKILGFAAAYHPDKLIPSSRSKTAQYLREQLNPLPAAEKEVITLEEHFSNGDYFYGNDANETTFKKYAADYSILHLAMHGLLNAQQPLLSSLVFTEDNDSLENNFLEAHEISSLELNNDLVVLSACETGYGKFAQGEGVLSLARSFMYAGTPSLLVSLWQVNDNSTAVIMRFFYDNLQQGMTKDKALAEAKRYYLEHTTGLAAHPAFWSPFIQLGDSSSITLRESNAKLYIGLAAVVALFLTILLYSRRPK